VDNARCLAQLRKNVAVIQKKHKMKQTSSADYGAFVRSVNRARDKNYNKGKGRIPNPMRKAKGGGRRRDYYRWH
jgi:hypothetical protein